MAISAGGAAPFALKPARRRFGQFIAAGKIQALVQVIRGQSPVVGDLFIEEMIGFRTAG